MVRAARQLSEAALAAFLILSGGQLGKVVYARQSTAHQQIGQNVFDD